MHRHLRRSGPDPPRGEFRFRAPRRASSDAADARPTAYDDVRAARRHDASP